MEGLWRWLYGDLVVLGHDDVGAAQDAVVDAAADQAHRAGELRVFVHLHIALRPDELAQGVATTQPTTKEIVLD